MFWPVTSKWTTALDEEANVHHAVRTIQAMKASTPGDLETACGAAVTSIPYADAVGSEGADFGPIAFPWPPFANSESVRRCRACYSATGSPKIGDMWRRDDAEGGPSCR